MLTGCKAMTLTPGMKLPRVVFVEPPITHERDAASPSCRKACHRALKKIIPVDFEPRNYVLSRLPLDLNACDPRIGKERGAAQFIAGRESKDEPSQSSVFDVRDEPPVIFHVDVPIDPLVGDDSAATIFKAGYFRK